jgi:hypothetical protein
MGTRKPLGLKNKKGGFFGRLLSGFMSKLEVGHTTRVIAAGVVKYQELYQYEPSNPLPMFSARIAFVSSLLLGLSVLQSHVKEDCC